MRICLKLNTLHFIPIPCSSTTEMLSSLTDLLTVRCLCTNPTGSSTRHPTCVDTTLSSYSTNQCGSQGVRDPWCFTSLPSSSSCYSPSYLTLSYLSKSCSRWKPMQYTITYYRLRNNELAVNLRMIICYKTIEINFHASATFLTLFIVNAD